MDATRAEHSGEQHLFDIEEEDTQTLWMVTAASRSTPVKKTLETIDTIEATSIMEQPPIDLLDTAKTAGLAEQRHEKSPIEALDTTRIASLPDLELMEATATSKLPGVPQQRVPLTRSRAIILAGLLLVLILHASTIGPGQFNGSQGWYYVLGGPSSTGNTNVLAAVKTQINKKQGLTPGSLSQPMTPQLYINLIMQKMTLEQKLGQMMIVQFTGPNYSVELDTMIRQYNVGAVLIFSANGNISDKAQLRGLTRQMQSSIPSGIPLAIAIDQEGGRVDRLVTLDGTRPSATSIGESNNLSKATAAGIQDAKDLASYGINLNLAPVVDVDNIYNPQIYDRTFGKDAATVTKFARAYLQGLQQSGKVVGTLKHFPGLGDVADDPHNSVPYLTRSQHDLEAIDWAPYHTLIQQGNVHAVMVTHEIVTALDTSNPSSLSQKVVTGILRNELGFQGVVMTDSLTMEGIKAYYTEAQAAVRAVHAGDDLLMGATSASEVANMIEGLKQAVNAGNIRQQRIDDSVRRILMLKYEMGLLSIPAV